MEEGGLSDAEARELLLDVARKSGVELREDVFDVLLELTRLDVVPTAVAQVLKSLCSKAAAAEKATGASKP